MLPNWYGVEGIGFEWRGPWNEPILHYRGHTFYNFDIEDGLWNFYIEDGGDPDNDGKWVAYVNDYAVDYLDDIIFERWGE